MAAAATTWLSLPPRSTGSTRVSPTPRRGGSSARAGTSPLTNAHSSGGTHTDPGIAEAIRALHGRLAPEVEDWTFADTASIQRHAAAGGDIAAVWARIERKLSEPPAISDLFEPPTVRTYPWLATYDTRSYLAMLASQSSYALIEPARRDELLRHIGQLIDALLGGVITKEYVTILAVAQTTASAEPDLRFHATVSGTAAFYDRYRPPYPTGFLTLRRRLPASGRERLLDLACGTGQIALPLADSFAEVWAVDQEVESVAYGRGRAEARGATNITWVAGAAETVTAPGPYELVAVGNAFHRLNRRLVAERMYSWLAPAEASPCCGAARHGPVTGRGRRLWPSCSKTGWPRRARPTGSPPAERQPYNRSPMDRSCAGPGSNMSDVSSSWSERSGRWKRSPGSSTPRLSLSQQALGDAVVSFEADLTRRLHSFQPEGTFELQASYAYDLARKPT